MPIFVTQGPMQSAFSRFIITGLLTVLMVASCTVLRRDDIPQRDDLISATAYLYGLKEAGKLPGITSNGGGGTFRSVPISISPDGLPALLEMTVQATLKKGKDIVFWYRLERTNQAADWQLVKAWKIDDHGRREDLPLAAGDGKPLTNVTNN